MKRASTSGSVMPVMLIAGVVLVTIAAISKFTFHSKASVKRGGLTLDARMTERRLATIFSSPEICQDSLRTATGFALVTATPSANQPIVLSKILMGATSPNPTSVFDANADVGSSLSQNGTLHIKAARITNITQIGSSAALTPGSMRNFSVTLEFDLADSNGHVLDTVSSVSNWLAPVGNDELRTCSGGVGGMTGEFQDFLMEMGGSFFGMAHYGGDPAENVYPTAAQKADPTKHFWWCGAPGTWGASNDLAPGTVGPCGGTINSRINAEHDRLITGDLSFKICMVSSVDIDADDSTWGTLDAHYYRISKEADGFHMHWRGHVHYFWLWYGGQWHKQDSAVNWYPVIHANFGVRCIK